ncbi:hypothetical protein B0H13DRAFT_2326443 [Mycena leptocephala]|nr:hypothetical protein B0H13DRAFT_2326443 [Mycena leptocephala]
MAGAVETPDSNLLATVKMIRSLQLGALYSFGEPTGETASSRVVDAIKAGLRSPPTTHFYWQFGVQCMTRSTEELRLFLERPLATVLDLTRAAAISMSPGPSQLEFRLEGDALSKLLHRFRLFSDSSREHPISMAELRPVRMPEAVALSKMSGWAKERTMEVAAGKAGGNLLRFLRDIREKELLTDGYYLFMFPKVADEGWGQVIGGEKDERVVQLRHGGAVLNVFVGKIFDSLLAIGSRDSVEIKEEDRKMIMEACIGRRGLLDIFFRLGVYQDVPGCPFEGMESKLPSQAFRLFMSALYSSTTAGGKDRAVSAMLDGLLGAQVDLIVTAYGIFNRVVADDLAENSEGSSPAKRRRVFAPVQPGDALTLPSTPAQDKTAPLLQVTAPPSTPQRRTLTRTKSAMAGPPATQAAATSPLSTSPSVKTTTPPTSPPAASKPSPRALALAAAQCRSLVPGRTSEPVLKVCTRKRTRLVLDEIWTADLSKSLVRTPSILKSGRL